MKINKMRKFSALALASACVVAALGATACGKKEPQPEQPQPTSPELKSISLAYSPERSYVVGDSVKLDGNSLILKYDNSETILLPIASEGIIVTADAETAGQHTGKISYEGLETQFIYNVYNTLDDAVTVTGGDIAGCITDDEAVEMYKGIPYAAPPVGELRWRAPQDVSPWEGVLECYRFGESAVQNVPQISDSSVTTGVSEDCLTLNIWTSGRETADKPVIVYLHGSDNYTGGTSSVICDGEAIAREDAVFVSVNYRLGIYGFFSCEELAEEQDGCGNFAILDQIKALQWVQDNIAVFGGDKNNVTVVGQGMGGMDVEALLCSPLAEGLFGNAAILSSGMYFLQELPTLEQSYYDTKNYTLEELRAMSAEELTELQSNRIFSPVYDNYVINEPNLRDAFLKDAGNSSSVNLLIGLSASAVSLFDIRLSPSSTGPKAQADAALAQRNMLINARLKGGATGNNYLYYFSGNDDSLYWLGNKSLYTTWKDANTALAEICYSYLINFARTGDPNGINAATKEDLPEWNVSHGDYGYLFLQGMENEYSTMMDVSISDFEKYYSEFSEFFPSHE